MIKRKDNKTSSNLLRAFLRNKDGVTAVEFGILAPVFIIFTLYLIQLGLVMFIQNALDAGVREGGRFGITPSAGATPAQRQTNVSAKIRSVVDKFSGGMVNQSNLTIYATAYTTLQQNQQITPGPGSQNFGNPGDTVNYLVTYSMPTIVPIVGSTFGVTLKAQTTFVVESS